MIDSVNSPIDPYVFGAPADGGFPDAETLNRETMAQFARAVEYALKAGGVYRPHDGAISPTTPTIGEAYVGRRAYAFPVNQQYVLPEDRIHISDGEDEPTVMQALAFLAVMPYGYQQEGRWDEVKTIRPIAVAKGGIYVFWKVDGAGRKLYRLANTDDRMALDAIMSGVRSAAAGFSRP